jgi:hypothetical protein
MIMARINPADLDKLAQKPELFVQAVARKVRKFVLLLQRKIVNEKLQGQVLQHRSGKLGRSIHALPVVVEGQVVTGAVEGAGPPATYGVYQELGGERCYTIEPKTKKALAFIAHGGAKEFAKKVAHPPIKQHSFMRSSLDEMTNEIVTDLQTTEAQ